MPLDLPPFLPHLLIRGGHLQTILGSTLADHCATPGLQHRVPLADGDTIVLHDDGASTNGSQKSPAAHTPIALLLHGLGGCHESGYMVRCSAKLRARGIHVFRMNLRGCGAGLALARHPVHAGRSEDAAAALNFLAQCCPAAPVHLVGFSLGGNIALKFAGEAGPQPPNNLASVLAVAPPIDLATCSRHLRTGLGRFYDAVFLKGLFKHVKQRSALCADALVRPLSPRPRSVFEFDDLFTAPLSGFASANDYYERASSKPLLAQINIPTLIIAAANDPIVPVSSFANAAVSASTQLVITPCGGHLGYLGRTSSDPDRRWLDWRIVEWITAQRVAVPSPVGGEAQRRAMNAGPAGVVEWAGRVVHEGRPDLILG